MDVKKVTLDGNDLLRDWASGILYTQVNWKQLRTDSSSRELQGAHGRVRTVEYARYRKITVEWVIDGTGNEYFESSYKYLTDLLSLQDDTSDVMPRSLLIRDMFNEERTIDVTVVEPVEIVDYDDNMPWAGRKWRAVFESLETPIYKSSQELSITSTKTWFGGFAVPFAVPFSMGALKSAIDLNAGWNQKTPLIITIKATDAIVAPLRIKNVTTGTEFILDTDADVNDEIIINSETNTVTINGVDAIAYRVSGSEWMYAKWATRLLVFDANPDLSSTFDVNIRFRNSLL